MLERGAQNRVREKRETKKQWDGAEDDKCTVEYKENWPEA